MSNRFVKQSENPLLINFHKFPEETQKLIASQERDKEINAQKIGLIGRIFGEYPQVHYAMILIVILICILSVGIFVKIDKIEFKHLSDVIVPIITLLIGYIFGIKQTQ